MQTIYIHLCTCTIYTCGLTVAAHIHHRALHWCVSVEVIFDPFLFLDENKPPQSLIGKHR